MFRQGSDGFSTIQNINDNFMHQLEPTIIDDHDFTLMPISEPLTSTVKQLKPLTPERDETLDSIDMSEFEKLTTQDDKDLEESTKDQSQSISTTNPNQISNDQSPQFVTSHSNTRSSVTPVQSSVPQNERPTLPAVSKISSEFASQDNAIVSQYDCPSPMSSYINHVKSHDFNPSSPLQQDWNSSVIPTVSNPMSPQLDNMTYDQSYVTKSNVFQSENIHFCSTKKSYEVETSVMMIDDLAVQMDRTHFSPKQDHVANVEEPRFQTETKRRTVQLSSKHSIKRDNYRRIRDSNEVANIPDGETFLFYPLEIPDGRPYNEEKAKIEKFVEVFKNLKGQNRWRCKHPECQSSTEFTNKEKCLQHIQQEHFQWQYRCPHPGCNQRVSKYHNLIEKHSQTGQQHKRLMKLASAKMMKDAMSNLYGPPVFVTMGVPNDPPRKAKRTGLHDNSKEAMNTVKRFKKL